MKTLTQFIREDTKACTCYLLIGLPGAGKSTWCKENHDDLPIVSRDITRAELGYTDSADDKAVLSKKKESEVTRTNDELINKYVYDKKDFIIDDTNLNKKYRTPLIESLRKRNVKVIGVRFNTPLDTCIERRKGQIPEDVMRDIAKRMTPLDDDEVDDIIDVNSK